MSSIKYDLVAHTDSDDIDPYLQAYYLYHSRYRNANYASSLPLEQVSS
jgi:hypothetical protein